MAKVEGEYIAVYEMKGNKSGSALEVKRLRYNGVVGRRAVLNGVIKFDHWYTTLSASDFSVNSSGGNVASLASISSYGVDVENESHELGYDLSQETIGANNTSSSKTHSITVTQRGSGQSLRITATQSARKYSYTEYYTPSVDFVSIGTFAASGNETKLLTVYWEQSYRDYYDNGSYEEGIASGVSTATITNGSANNSSGAYINQGGIYCPSAGKNPYSSTRLVYTISSYYFYANGVYGSGGYVYVYQSANNVSTSTGSLVLSVSSNVSKFSSSGGTATISYQSYKPYTKIWSSGESESGETSISATLSTTYGSLGTSSVSGRGTTTLNVDKETTGTDKTATITIKAEGTTKTVSITQTKRVVSSTSYSEPSVVGTYQDANIPAWGGTAYLMVNWSQTKYTNYDNDTYTSSTVTGTSKAKILGGTVQQTGASLQSDGGIYKNSCGTVETPQRAVYTVTAYYFTANGVGRDVRSVTIHLGQAPNSVTGTSWLGTYNLSISHSPSGNLANVGGSKTISVDCKENGTITYTSTATKATTRNATASLTTTAGTLSPTSITGNGTSTLTVNENTSSQRTITVTAKAGSTSKATSFVQNAVAWVFTAAATRVEVAYNATSVTLSGTSSRNGFYQDISKSNVSASSGTVGTVTSSGTTFNIPITFTANSDTTSKTITVTVTQPLSGNKLTYTVVQAAKPAETNWIQWRDNRGTWSPATSGRFTFSAALLYSKELHGKGATVSIIPMKGSTEIASATSVTLNGTSYNASMYVQNISIDVRTTNDGSTFYLKAIYGNDTETIQLDSDLT